MPTYGFKSFNADNQVTFDSDEGHAHFIKVATTTLSSPGGADYPSGFEFNTLLFGRPTTTSVIGESGYSTPNRQFFTSATTPVELLKADISTSNVSNFATGYGLNIFDGTGTAEADLLFSSNTDTALDIITVGEFSSIGAGSSNITSINVPINSTAPHYVLIPGSYRYIFTTSITAPGFSGANVEEHQRAYKFNYTSGTLNSIDILNKKIFNGVASPLSYGGASYMIVKLRS